MSDNLETVKKFISTVVLIDDQIDFSTTDISKRNIIIPNDFEAGSNDNVSTAHISAKVKYFDIVSSFAKHGIVCLPYQWIGTNDENIKKLIANTDITIIDWELSQKEETALNTIEVIIEESQKGSLKYVVVYTSKGDGAKEALAKLGNVNKCGNCFSFKDSNLCVVCCVEVIAKIDDSLLATSVTEGFAKFCEGKLKESVLGAISAVRKNSFKLLHRYDIALDKGIDEHHNYVNSTYGVSKYVTSLISSDIKDILTEDTDFKNIQKKLFPEKEQSENAVGKKDSCKNATTDNENTNLRFSELDIFKYFIKDEKFQPRLRLGTIVGNNQKYYVCLQPVCETLRFSEDEKRGFLFLELSVGKENHFDYIVSDKEQPIKLKLNTKAANTFIFEFKKTEGLEYVSAQKDSGSEDYIYTSSDSTSVKLVWLGELKDHYCIELANMFANNMAKTGYDNFEWLRKKRTKNN